jgi:hypothetical protein
MCSPHDLSVHIDKWAPHVSRIEWSFGLNIDKWGVGIELPGNRRDHPMGDRIVQGTRDSQKRRPRGPAANPGRFEVLTRAALRRQFSGVPGLSPWHTRNAGQPQSLWRVPWQVIHRGLEVARRPGPVTLCLPRVRW